MTPEETKRHHQFLRSFTMHEPAVRAFIRRMLPSRADADDVMQEVSVVLWKKFADFREGSDFRPWAFGVARFEVLAWFRDRGRDRLVLNEEVVNQLAVETARDEARFEQQREALDLCMGKITPEQRELLMHAYQAESQIQEVARTSGRTVTGFYQWLHRMRRSLLKCIKSEIFKEGAS